MTYLSLFTSSFLAATILPIGSEIHFAYLIEKENFWSIVFIATLGNSLGSVFTYYLGWIANWKWIEKVGVKKEKVEQFSIKISKHGALLGFIVWVPIVGDVLAVGLGIFRVNPGLSLLYITIGKLLRYLALGYSVIYTLY